MYPKLGESRKYVCHDVFAIDDVFWFMLNVLFTYDVTMSCTEVSNNCINF
jgi:hypothetical protein